MRECVLAFHPSAGNAEPWGSAQCSVDTDGRWHAHVAANVALDLKLEARGFAPVYWFAVSFESGNEHDLGARRLHKGGSISGYVRDLSGSPIEGAEVVAIPVAPSGEDVTVRSQRAHTDRRGFFQITTLAEGTWHLQSKSDGRASADGGLVDVRNGEENALDRALTHLGLQSVDIYITPAVDRAGHPWRIALIRPLSPRSRTSKTVSGGDAGANGFWRAERLDPGEYTVSVRTADGGVRKRESIRLDQGTQIVSIVLGDVAVRGKVRFGNVTMATKVTFTDDEGAQVPADTDEDGEYELSLPHEGTWHVEVSSDSQKLTLFRLMKTEVKRRDGEEFARVDIDLPSGRVFGTVVDAAGKPTDAIVIVHREQEMVAQIFAAGGTFDIAGVREGPAQIDARTPASQSELLPIDITEKTEVELRMRAQQTLRGVVVSREGHPVAGAILRATSSGFDGITSAVTGGSGRFEMKLPSTEQSITLIVLAPAHPIRMIHVPAGYSLGEPVRVVAAPIGGRLRVRFPGAPPWPSIQSAGEPVSLALLLYPRNAAGYPGGLSENGFAADVEPSEYMVCVQRPERRCGTAKIVPGGDGLIDLEPVKPGKEP